MDGENQNATGTEVSNWLWETGHLWVAKGASGKLNFHVFTHGFLDCDRSCPVASPILNSTFKATMLLPGLIKG